MNTHRFIILFCLIACVKSFNFHRKSTENKLDNVKSKITKLKSASNTRVIDKSQSEPKETALFKVARTFRNRKFFLLPLLCYIPVKFYGIEECKRCLYVFFLGIFGSSLASSGAPIAGGIVNMPVLSYYGLRPSECVAFSAAAQAFGIGFCSFLNWSYIRPDIFITSIFPYTLIPGLIGLLLAKLVIPLSDRNIQIFFSLFCIIIAIYTIHGLQHELATQDEPVVIKHSVNPLTILLTITSLIGGLVTGWVGIGIEKFLFVLLTLYCKADVLKSCITSVTIVGWLSVIGGLIHAFKLKNLPVLHWLMVLPGKSRGFMTTNFAHKNIDHIISYDYCIRNFNRIKHRT
jgi:uncharacterized membrane protein YfcA